MKKITFLLMIAIISMIVVSCSDDEQPRYIKVEILKNTGNKIVEAENRIDADRSTNDPSSYDSLARYWANEVMLVLQEELPGAIDQVVGTYDEYWREHSPRHQKTVWVRIDVGVNAELYRVCPDYSEKALQRLHNYCESVVNGGIDWASGERIPWIEDEIIHLFVFNPDEDPDYFWQYYDRLVEYFLKFAQNPNHKAKYKRNGFMNFGWGQ